MQAQERIEVTKQKVKMVTSLTKDILQIRVFFNNQTFQAKYTNDNLPLSFSEEFGSIQYMNELLKNPDNYSVSQKGELKITSLTSGKVISQQLKKVSKKSQKSLKTRHSSSDEDSRQSPIGEKIFLFYQKRTFYSRFFQVKGRMITYTGGRVYTQLLMREQIPKDRIYQFTYKIVKTKKRNIYLGVVNKQARFRAPSSFSSGFAIAYSGRDGKVWFGNVDKYVEKGIGFKEGETVITVVDLQQGKICWKVDEQIRAQFSSSQIKQPYQTYVPYLQLSYPGDTIQWLK